MSAASEVVREGLVETGYAVCPRWRGPSRRRGWDGGDGQISNKVCAISWLSGIPVSIWWLGSVGRVSGSQMLCQSSVEIADYVNSGVAAERVPARARAERTAIR